MPVPAGPTIMKFMNLVWMSRGFLMNALTMSTTVATIEACAENDDSAVSWSTSLSRMYFILSFWRTSSTDRSLSKFCAARVVICSKMLCRSLAAMYRSEILSKMFQLSEVSAPEMRFSSGSLILMMSFSCSTCFASAFAMSLYVCRLNSMLSR